MEEKIVRYASENLATDERKHSGYPEESKETHREEHRTDPDQQPLTERENARDSQVPIFLFFTRNYSFRIY